MSTLRSRITIFYLAVLITIVKAAPSLAVPLQPQTLLATPKGGTVLFQGRTVKSEELNTAIKKARPGDTVFILPGTYHQQLYISKQGDEDYPITISGHNGLSVFSCADLPANEGMSPIKISVSKGITLQGLKFESCWPTAIEISDSNFIVLNDLQFMGGKSPIVVKHRSAHHILIENNQWEQSADAAVLQSPLTAFLPDGKFSDYAGYFVHLESVGGNVVIRNNKIKNAYGGVLVSKQSKNDDPVFNLFISNNTFENIKSKVIEVTTKISQLAFHDNQTNGVGESIPLEISSKILFLTRTQSEEPTPYPNKSVILSWGVQGNNVQLQLTKSDVLKGVGTLSLEASPSQVLTSKPCTQTKYELKCRFDKAPPTHDELKGWLEMTEATPLSLWQSPIIGLKLVRKPK